MEGREGRGVGGLIEVVKVESFRIRLGLKWGGEGGIVVLGGREILYGKYVDLLFCL